MNKNTLKSRTESFGDFYLHYTRTNKDKKKVRRLEVGTTDFDNKYILSKLPRGLTLATVRDEAEKVMRTRSNLLFWSWTADRLMTLPAKSISRVTSMSAELKNVHLF